MSDHDAPVAWAALGDDDDIAWIGYDREAAADGARGRPVVPLYRSPTLTDEEREAIALAKSRLGTSDGDWQADDVLAALLERLE